jgi:hypothetical protein
LSGSYPNPSFRKNVVPLTLNAGWEPNGGSATPAIWKDSYDVVHFIGSLDRASGTSDQPFTLPPEFRPTAVKFPGITVGGGFGFLTIDPDGTVTASGLTPATASPADFLGIEDVEFQAGTGGSQKAAAGGGVPSGAGPG